jgi:hypothetical protein
MIRIDEIYNNTFWPFIEKFIPKTRMFFCDPFGHSDIDHLFNNSHPDPLHYILLHDQEPIHLDIHTKLFNEVKNRTLDIRNSDGRVENYYPRGLKRDAIITSERNSDAVNYICNVYGWKSYYYFFHGWAALDWYRGYDKTFLMPKPEDRVITKSFINPNRIIGGKRQHRVLLMYHLLKMGIKDAWISFPKVCPAEGTDIDIIVKEFARQCPDIHDVFSAAGLPWNFPGEEQHPMHSCWLSLFNESAESVAYVVTETVFEGHRHHLTEKTFKPICLGMPFILASTAGSLKYLRDYGFKTFDTIWDESYDDEPDDHWRMNKIAKLLKSIDNMTINEKQELFNRAIPIVKHNYDHFYGGTFEKILWQELNGMLNELASDLA